MKNRFKTVIVFIKKHIIFALLVAVIFAVCVADFVAKIKTAGEMSWWKIIMLVGGIVLVIAALLGIFFVQNKRSLNYKKLFLLFVLPLGMIYMIIAPLGTGNDEPNHYLRAYEIAQGKMISESVDGKVGGEVPEGIIEVLDEDAKTYSGMVKMMGAEMGDGRVARVYSNTALYSPLSYLPQATGMFLGGLFNASPFWLGMIARLFNFLAYVGICYLGFRYLPRFKLFFLIFLTSPQILSSATSLSADAFIVALVFLFTALVLHCKYESKNVNLRQAASLIAMSGLIAGCKITYLPVVLLIFILDKNCFKKKGFAISLKLACVAIGLAVGLIWVKISSGLLSVAYPLAGEQMKYVITNPFKFVIAMVRTIASEITLYLENLFSAAPLYHNRVPLYSIIRLGFVLIGLLALFNEKSENKMSIKDKRYIWAVMLIIVGAIAGALYTQWTPQHCGNTIGCNRIMGIQGRYFIPVVTLGVMTIPKLKRWVAANKIVAPFLALHLFAIILTVTAFIG